jgi:hypothetical protein
MGSKIIIKILAILFSTIFLSAFLLIFIQNIYIFLISLIIILCIIIGMLIGLEHIRSEKIVAFNKKNEKAGKLENILLKELNRSNGGKTPDKVVTLLCPMCGGKELYYEAGLITGYKYHCKDCDYIGAFVIEKEFKI